VARYIADGNVALHEGAVPAMLDSTIGHVIERQALVVVETPAAGQIAGAPMPLHNQVIGALVVMPGQRVTLDKRELSVLQTLANQAAVAVHNARLYEESERLRAQTTALYEEACHQKAELEKKNSQLAKARRWLAAARQQEAVDAERSRIARELHDSVAQHLICIGMNLEWCRAQLAEQSPIYERIRGAKELARSAVTHMREAIFQLSTIDNVQSSLVSALRELILDFEKTAQLPIELRTSGGARPLSAEIEHALYRITQEALFNVYKHAQATAATVEVIFAPDQITLVVGDNGVGIAGEHLSAATCEMGDAPTSFGLRNMCSRAHELGGTCRIARQPYGTEVRVALPLP